LGTFGANRNGLVDLAGNVWEWTDTCFTRNALDERGGSHVLTSSCGVRVVEGRHRAYLADFIRDARGGGCAAGSPPKNLGFRLVREADESRGPWQGLRQSISSARHLFGFAALGSPRPPVDL
jgi:formylglycine-generating enzyme required for sulfatase activity